MDKIRELIHKYADVLVYLFFGVLTTAVNYLVYLPCFNLIHFSAAVSNVIAWVAAVLFAFVTNRKWVFQSTRRGAAAVFGELLTFAGGRVLTFLLQEMIFFAFFDLLAWNEYAVKIVAAVLVVVLNLI